MSVNCSPLKYFCFQTSMWERKATLRGLAKAFCNFSIKTNRMFIATLNNLLYCYLCKQNITFKRNCFSHIICISNRSNSYTLWQKKRTNLRQRLDKIIGYSL